MVASGPCRREAAVKLAPTGSSVMSDASAILTRVIATRPSSDNRRTRRTSPNAANIPQTWKLTTKK